MHGRRSLMLDRISITGLRVRGNHGVFTHERESGQEFVIDAVLWLDTEPAAASDDLRLTADYGALASRLAEIVGGEPVALIETLAARLAAACLQDQAVCEAEVTVHKPQAPVTQEFADIAVTIRRSRACRSRGDGSRRVVVSLGSNLGDRIANLQLGIDVLAAGDLAGLAVSGVFETDPVGGPEQDNYLNVVLLAASAMSAPDILALCAAAETAAGRERMLRWGPRTLDADIIVCGDEVSSNPELTIPHPRAHERAFVLVPWLDVDPGAVLPGWGRVADLAAAVGAAGVRRRPELALTLPSAASREAGLQCT
jgi:dihydroneopterin aldolase / 2-amino-4-hydroxy-6-hydroxymethyldihydropteridine diphosphokinase